MSKMYNEGLFQFLNQAYDWTSGSVGVLLTTSTYVPDQDHEHVDDVTNELSGGGYARLTALATRTTTKDDTNNRVILDGDDIVFPSLGAAAGTPAFAVVYDNTTGVDSTRNLIGWITLTTPDVPDGNNYNITWDAVGLWVVDTD